MRSLHFTAAAALLFASALGAQAPSLIVERDGRATVTLDAAALRKLPTDTVSLSSHGAPPVRYRVVNLLNVMAAAGSPIDSLRLGHAAWIVVAYSKDDYISVFSAPEIEPKLGPSRVFVALERDGAPLTDKEGPVQLIVPTDQHGTRSARMVTRLRIFDPLATR
jgi:hypothetical protein